MAEDTCLVMNDAKFTSHGGADSEVQRIMPVDVETLDPFVLGDGFPLHMSSNYTHHFSPLSHACTLSSLSSILSTNIPRFSYFSFPFLCDNSSTHSFFIFLFIFQHHINIFQSLFLLHILRSFLLWCYLQFLHSHHLPSLCTHPHASCFLVLLPRFSSIFQFYSILFLNFNPTTLFCLHHHSVFLLLQLHALKLTHFLIIIHPFLTTRINHSSVLIPAPSFVMAGMTERLCLSCVTNVDLTLYSEA